MAPAERQPAPASGWRTLPGLPGLLTAQEVKLLALVMGMLLLGLTVRFWHLTNERSRLLPVQNVAAVSEKSAP